MLAKWETLTNGWHFCCIPKNASTSIRKHRKDHYFHPFTSLKVAVIRHPLDRLVSCFADNKAYENGNFVQFVDKVCNIEDEDLEAHAKPQYLYLQPFPDKLILFENVSKEFAAAGLPLEVMNNSERSDWRSYFTDELRAMAETKYAEDLRLYNECRRQQSS